MLPELLYTEDGSHTILNKELNVTYHSIHGAVQESKHIYIESGLNYVLQKYETLNILEVGFGSGLNTLLTYKENLKDKNTWTYQTIEKFPLSRETFALLNYGESETAEIKKVFNQLHTLEWNKVHPISDSFYFTKYLIDVNSYAPENPIHLVYYDAFAPDTTKEMWNKEIFEKLFKAMVPGACLLTFCAKGDIKRLLKTCGFKVEALPGPKGKREITRAIKE